MSKESNEWGKWVEIIDEVKCMAAGEMDIFSADGNPTSMDVVGPLIPWLEEECGEEEDPDDEGQGDKLKVEDSTDPTEIEQQASWLFGITVETLLWSGI